MYFSNFIKLNDVLIVVAVLSGNVLNLFSPNYLEYFYDLSFRAEVYRKLLSEFQLFSM